MSGTLSVRCRRYVYQDSKSHKYWTYFIPLCSATTPVDLRTHWFAHSGRVGTAGIWHTFLFGKVSPPERIRSKVDEHYYRPDGPEYTILISTDELAQMQRGINRERLGRLLREANGTAGPINPATKPRPRSEVPVAKPKDRSQLKTQLDKLMNL